MLGSLMSARSAISPTREEDFPGWYQEVVRQADMAEMAHVRGCMVIKPWGFGIWERIQGLLDEQIRARGHENVYFPLFIPLSYIRKEAEHVEGFAKEMAIVTHHRLESRNGELVPAGELDEPIVVRPTSEAIIGASMAQWVQSYRDLPLLLNQWANVVRWEMRPRVFLRTSEFLWQEGHTAHATATEAMEETQEMFSTYRSFAEEVLAMPVVPGEKPPSERFPGAERSFSIEAMMQDGKALQAGTSHFLGQNFARAAGITFLDETGTRSHAYTTSWGVSTRLIGAVVMTHGDDDGLIVPPAIAPHQVVVVPILRDESGDDEVLAYAKDLVARAANQSHAGRKVRIKLDDRQIRSVDKKWQWIKRGVPVLVEVGRRDVSENMVSFRVRTALSVSESASVDGFVSSIPSLLEGVSTAVRAAADQRLERGLRRDITSAKEARSFFEGSRGFLLAKWCGSPDCEVAFRDQGVTIRCLPCLPHDPDRPHPDLASEGSSCIACGSPAVREALFAQSY
jgi:prolyl-tRNA synthetase